ncbi:MAG: type II toxin-antitoxin system RelE/ParE family toxin [Oscillospiraceae bacterium]|nr:type II toxin-antitoxin system RelE/ParE family toxin [Oscillospiraceae bacterium]
MFEIIFYKDRSGKKPVLEYLQGLTSCTDKESRIKANKILDYIDYLRDKGQQVREPYAKHLDGDIWELRPIRDRILYAAWDGNKFILLHVFQKDTRKTPKGELNQARRNLADFKERGGNNE